ncbi:MAG: helix-turn-helix transcriptional regulator [Clostridia bacterium]|nr:helix-turn-helix transcriptional regulator [Clostridia bacterium]
MVEHNHFVFIAEGLRTCLYAFFQDGSVLETVNRAMMEEAPALPEELKSTLMSLLPCEGIRTVLVNGKYTYSLFQTPDRVLIVGPNLVINHQPYRYTVNVECPLVFQEDAVYELSIDTYQLVLLPSRNLYYEKRLSEAEYLNDNFLHPSEENVQKDYQELLFTAQEEQFSHNPYSLEKRMLSAIEQGDLVLLEECRRQEIIDTNGSKRFGTLSDNAERSYRNLAICAITLASRAAIRGGVNYELAFSLCDSYILEVERLKNLYGLQPLTEKAKTNFCTMVKEIRERQKRSEAAPIRNPLVEKAKDYVFANLHRKVTLSQTAEKLHVNQNYLSELFRKTEGVPFSSFIMTEKLKLARRMLMYSSYSYIDIANYLGFSSQSHFGKLFKERFGVTPREYRNQYSATEYQE